MLRIIGVFLLLLGSGGMALTGCREQQERLVCLKRIKQIYEYLHNEIGYAKTPLPEICRQLGNCQPPPFDRAFTEIFKAVRQNDGHSFTEIWATQMARWVKKLPLKKSETELLIGFPASLNARDSKGQAEEVAGYVAEVSRYIKEQEAELQNKCKVVMCGWIMGGIMVAIWLL